MKPNHYVTLVILLVIALGVIKCCFGQDTLKGEQYFKNGVGWQYGIMVQGKMVPLDSLKYLKSINDGLPPQQYSPPPASKSDTLEVKWLGNPKINYHIEGRLPTGLRHCIGINPDSAGLCSIFRTVPDSSYQSYDYEVIHREYKEGLREDGVVIWKRMKK